MSDFDAGRPPARHYDYVTDGDEIYRRSFGMIRDGADLSAFGPLLKTVVTRIVHAAGDLEITRQVAAHPGVVEAAREALASGAPILTDSVMLASGITRTRLPASNEVVCTLRDPRTPVLAKEWGTTRAAAAVSLWLDRLEGSVVAIGNAPTALFHLLEVLLDGGPRPAAIVGMPVGFVGSAESKVALAEHDLPGGPVPWITVHGHRGGSAMAAAAVNALATAKEIL
ncbi:MAG: precorrin-8X methylmutase [Propionibacteriaceae bacterium]|nr:precorrin-8X methylmutase [Propionibacteriaceae bacterium]